MANETVYFEIQVKNLDDLLTLTKTLKDAKVGVSDIAKAFKVATEQQKADLRELNALADIDEEKRKGRSQRKIDRAKQESKSAIDAAKATAIAEESLSKQTSNAQILASRLAKEASESDNRAKVASAKSVAIAEESVAKQQILASKLSTEQIRKDNLTKTKSTQDFGGSLSKLSGILTTFGIGLGIAGVGQFAKDIFNAQSKVEALRLTLGNLLGTTSGANLFKDIQDFTTRTPFTFEETIQGVNALVGSMKAAGIASSVIAKDVVPTLESLGNSASALGGGDRLNRLTYAFTQVQAAGRLMGTEVRQIAETGFPLLSALSQKLGISVQEVQRRIHEGALGFKDFKEAMLAAGKEGGVFSGSMDILSQTVSGKIAILKDNIFFAMAKIGDSFANTVKPILDFTNSFVTALGGTKFAVERTLDVVKTLIATFLAYKTVTAGTVVVEKISLLVRGELILANIALTGTYNVMTAAELRAATAARTLNAALISNPFGLIAIAIGTVVTGMILLREEQDKLKTDTKEAILPLEKEKVAFNSLAKAVMDKTLSHEEEIKTLKRLKAEHPDLIGNTKSLAEAEKILNANKIKTNSAYSFREQKLEILRNQFPIQLKGINNLEEAEARLGKVIRQTNTDFLLRGKLIENEVRTNFNNKIITDNLNEVITLESKINKIKKEGITFVSGTAGKLTKIAGTQEIADLQAQINKRNLVVQDGLKKNENIEEQSFNARKRLTFKYQEDIAEIEGTPKGTGKIGGKAKEFQPSAKLINMRKELVELEKVANETLKFKLDVLEKEKLADIQAETEKNKNLGTRTLAILDIEKKYIKDKEKLIEDNAKKELEIADKVSKEKIKLLDELNKSEEELYKAQRGFDEIRARFIVEEAHDRVIVAIDADRQLALSTATTEAEKMAILTEFNEREYQENIKYAKLNYDLKVKAITDELAILAKQQSQNEADAKDRKGIFAFANPENIELIKQYNLNVDTELKIANNKLQVQSEKISGDLLTIQTNYQNEALKAKKNHETELAKTTETFEQKQEREAKARFLRNLNTARQFYSAVKLLVVDQLDSTIASLEKIEGTTAKIQLARFKALKDSATGITKALDGIFKGVKFNSEKGGIFEGFNLGDIGKGGGKSLVSGLVSGLKGAITANPFGAVVAAYKVFDTIMTAIEQKRLAKVKAVQEAIIKQNNKDIAKLNADYEKIKKEIDDNYAKDLATNNKLADASTLAELERYGKQISNLVKSNSAKIAIEDKYKKESLKIRELYKEGLNSTDEKIRLSTEAIVDGMIANLAKKRNDALLEEIKIQDKRLQINKDADQAILDAKTASNDSLQEKIDEINTKRNQDLAQEGLSNERRVEINRDADNAIINSKTKFKSDLDDTLNKINEGRNKDLGETKTYEELLLDINKKYDTELIDWKKANQNATAQQLADHIATMNGLRLTDINNLNASAIGLASAEEASAATLAAIAEKKAADDYARQLKYDQAKQDAEREYRKQLYYLEKSSFEASKTIQIAELKVELAKAKRKLFGRGALMDSINEAIAEIQGLEYPAPAFYKGTDNTSENAPQRRVDSKGGFQAILHPDEQIFSKEQVDTMTRSNGGVRMTRSDVMNKIMNYDTVNLKGITPNIVNRIQNDNSKLEKEIKGLRRDLLALQGQAKIVNQVDKSGFNTYLQTRSKKINVLQNKYRQSV